MKVVKGVFFVAITAATVLHPMVHTETVLYVPTTTIVYNGGQVISATASTTVIFRK
jgi:hypothetical protein